MLFCPDGRVRSCRWTTRRPMLSRLQCHGAFPIIDYILGWILHCVISDTPQTRETGLPFDLIQLYNACIFM
jgi:hypothetical protein